MTSLAILPPRQAPSDAAPSQRPKLHINTQQLRTFGKGSSLRLDTLSAVSPTVRNTFSNAYEPPSAPAGRPALPRLSIDSTVPQASKLQGSSTPDSASTLSSALTSASSSDSATIQIPYKQPHNLTSILTNSPARQLIPRKMASTRPLFPAEKKVSFRSPLEEEIKTVKYVMAHSDLESSVSSSSTIASMETSASDSEASVASVSVASTSSLSGAPSSPAVPSPSNMSNSASFSSLEQSPRPRGLRAGDKRDSSESESDSDSCPETPVAGRRKRRRDWRWTLGPLASSAGKTSSSTPSDTTASGDDDSS